MPRKFTPLTPEQTENVYSLLCTIHRDGGHYIDAFGMDEAIKKAKNLVIENQGLVAGFLEGASGVT